MESHTTFPTTSTSFIVSQLYTGEDGDIIEPSIFRGLEVQESGPPKVIGIEDSSSEQEDEKQRKVQIRKELT